MSNLAYTNHSANPHAPPTPLKDLLDLNPRLHLESLPLYSPNLNKIEQLWGWLKSSVINNVFFHCREEIRAAVKQFVDYINTIPLSVIDRLCL